MLVKLVAMKARRQEVTFKRLVPQAEMIIVFDEPILSSYGSAFMNVGREAVISALREAIAPLQGLKEVHICGNTDYPERLSRFTGGMGSEKMCKVVLDNQVDFY